MKVPFKWLKDYVDVNISAQELSDRLTMSGSKVEEVITSGDEIQNVVTGKILKISAHPDAEKLVICEVEVAEAEPVTIVTGAKNMVEGDIVPVALHGASLPNGLKIKKGKLRGVMSNGMMCSEEELGIAGDKEVHGLMILPQDTTIGEDIKTTLSLDSSVIDFEITSNRPDCLSVLGMARETAATLGSPWRKPAYTFSATAERNIANELEVKIKDELCRRYVSRKLTNVKIQSSPQWMQDRLLSAGIRPINNIVDITNFVMVETGQPMHAFDARQIKTGNIVVEKAVNGESFITLDEIERELSSDMLTIKDGDRIVALAGIMGGLNSEVQADTTEIIFESANFNGTNIRVSAKALNLRTESSGKFEKDLDPNLALEALNRACNLVQELGAGDILQGTIDIYPVEKETLTMSVDSKWINKFLGTEISKETMKVYLDRLELSTEINGDMLEITVPTFRTDIAIKEDVAEEIARIFGYNNIPVTQVTSTSIRSGKYKKQLLDDKVIDTLISCGFNQSISYSFVSPKVFDKIGLPSDHDLRKVITIKNPLGEDFSVMRTSTIPSIMESLARNYSRNNEYVRLFEAGRVYIPNADSAKLPEERNILTIGMYGTCDFLDIKGVVEVLIEALGITGASFERVSDNHSFHPGKTAALVIKKEKCAVFGEIHPDTRDNFEVDERCFVAEINLDKLYSIASLDKKYKALPKFPAVTRDIALLVEDEVMVQQIQDIISRQGGNILESIKLFDVYKGKQIPEGKKSIAYSLVYRADNKTLTDAEVSKVHDKILKSLEYQLGAQLR